MLLFADVTQHLDIFEAGGLHVVMGCVLNAMHFLVLEVLVGPFWYLHFISSKSYSIPGHPWQTSRRGRLNAAEIRSTNAGCCISRKLKQQVPRAAWLLLYDDEVISYAAPCS